MKCEHCSKVLVFMNKYNLCDVCLEKMVVVSKELIELERIEKLILDFKRIEKMPIAFKACYKKGNENERKD